MPYIVLSNFRFGLDARRSELTTQPGTLQVAENCHVNPGGELEKRKAFIKIPLSITTSGAPVTTYGITALKDVMEVYGSTLEANIDAPSVPTNVKYRMIRRTLPSTDVSSIIHNVSAIIASTVFGGKSLVVAKMSDDSISLFYDGVLVPDMNLGQVFSWTTAPGVMRQLAQSINKTGIYTASYGTVSGSLSIYGQPGASYAISFANVTVAGVIVENKLSDSIPSTQAAIAVGSFKVLGGSTSAGVNKVSQVAVAATSLLAAAVDFNTSTTQTVIDLVTAINANSAVSGYRASAEGSVVRVFSTTSGATPNGKAIAVTAAGDVCIGRCVVSFAGTGFNLNYISANGTQIVTGAPIPYPQFAGQTLPAFATAVAAAIRAGSGVHGYTATATGVVLYVSKLVTSSADLPIRVDIEVFPTAGNSGVVFVGTDIDMLVAATKYVVFFLRGGTTQSPYWVSEAVTINPTGGVPPYSFSWPATNSDITPSQSLGVVSLAPLQPSGRTCQYRLVGAVGFVPSGTATLRCTVTDALGSVVESPDITFVLPGSSGV